MRYTDLVRAVDVALGATGALGPRIVVGLSGGADSTALLDALVTLAPQRGLAIVAAHLDHRLRKDSPDDANHCAALARSLGVPFHPGSADVAALAKQRGRGIEEAGRTARYAFLRQVCAQTGSSAVAVAHTRDDQVETLLLRLVRGSGGAGLRGMRPVRGRLIRPLLEVSRADVLAHLAARGLSFREDPSNADRRFARNRIRLDLVPYLEEQFNPRLRETLCRTARLVADEQELLAAVARREGPTFRLDGEAAVLDAKALRRAAPALGRLALRRALRTAGGLDGIGSVHIERLLALCAGRTLSGRKLCLPGGREAFLRFGELHLRKVRAKSAPFDHPLSVPGNVELSDGGRVLASEAAAIEPVDSGSAAFVRAEPGTALTVRSRREGDRVRSGGRSISLKRFLLQRRVPADLRDALPLVAIGRDILWVPGWPSDGPEPGRIVRVELVRGT